MQQAMALLARMLEPEVAALLDRLQSALARPATSAGPVRDCCVESLNALRMRRKDFFPALVEQLDNGLAQAMLGSRLLPRPGLAAALPSASGLQLLDDDAIDEEGTLAAIATRHEHRASLALLLSGQRFGVMLGSPPLLGAALPVGPHALGNAMAVAARRIGLCAHARMTLLRVYDMEFMTRYPGFIEAVDASIDRAGILPGLAFVPLRPVAAAQHAERGRGGQQGAVPEAEAQAAKVLTETIQALRQDGRFPDSLASERNSIISAMARYLLRYGQDSKEWREGLEHARSVLQAVQRGEPPSMESRKFIDSALRSIGYADEDAHRLAMALTSVRSVPEAVLRRADGLRSAREQRCVERLANLSIGTRLGFSTGRGGFTRCRLRYHYVEPGLLLLANEADGQEALFEIDAVARQMASGHAWIVRAAPAATAPGEPQPGQSAWPTHAHGRGLS